MADHLQKFHSLKFPKKCSCGIWLSHHFEPDGCKVLPKISGKSLVRKREGTMSFRRESSESFGKVKLFTQHRLLQATCSGICCPETNMNCLTVLHKSLNPGPPLTMNFRFRVYNNQDIPKALGKTRIMHSSKKKNQGRRRS